MSATLSSSSPMATTHPTLVCKLVIIGNSSVGKSSLLIRFFDEQQPPDNIASTTGGKFRVSQQTPFL